MPRRRLLLVVALGAVGSLSVGCADAMLPRGETMAVQNTRYQLYASGPGSTGTIENPGARANGLKPLPAGQFRYPADDYYPGSTRGAYYVAR